MRFILSGVYIPLSNMIKVHSIACVAAAILMVLHALFTPFYEMGYARITSPILFLAMSFIFLSMLRKKQWAWRWTIMFSAVHPIIQLAFFPTVEFFGAYTSLATILAALEIAVCVIVFASMWLKTVKAQYFPVVQV